MVKCDEEGCFEGGARGGCGGGLSGGLVKCDEEGILKDVRKAVEGVK